MEINKFVNRKDDGVFECTHQEAVGIFKVKKPTFGLDMEIERMVGVLAGVSPTEQALLMAENMAVLSLAFEDKPEGFNPANVIRTHDLIPALYEEVVAYWRSFRG